MRFSFLLISSVLFAACVQHDLSPKPPVCDNSDLSLTVSDIAKATSCDINDGFIQVKATGGVSPYTFKSGSVTTVNGVFDSLPSGVYSISVADSKGCEVTLSNLVVSATGFDFEAVVNPDTDCTDGNGSIMITINDGTPPYLYKFMQDDFSETSVFTGLSSGQYDIQIKDSEGCSAQLSITVLEESSETSWINTIRPMIETYCATTGCHNGTSRPDLRAYDKAKIYAAQIKSLTADRSMPFEGSLTQDQIDLIGCWVDEGAREN
jgi:hypothetical protein